MKKYLLLGSVAICLTIIFIACAKSEPMPNDKISVGELSTLKNSTPNPTPNPTPTPTPTTTTGGFAVWTTSSVYSTAGTIYVYVDGLYKGSISTYYSVAPSCGASGIPNISLSYGTHNWYATSINGYYWGTSSVPNSVTISSSCKTMQLTLQ